MLHSKNERVIKRSLITGGFVKRLCGLTHHVVSVGALADGSKHSNCRNGLSGQPAALFWHSDAAERKSGAAVFITNPHLLHYGSWIWEQLGGYEKRGHLRLEMLQLQLLQSGDRGSVGPDELRPAEEEWMLMERQVPPMSKQCSEATQWLHQCTNEKERSHIFKEVPINSCLREFSPNGHANLLQGKWLCNGSLSQIY